MSVTKIEHFDWLRTYDASTDLSDFPAKATRNTPFR